MEPVLVVVVLGLVAVAVALWLTWTANRLDRIHHRIDVARGALDGQLLRRSGATLELARRFHNDAVASALALRSRRPVRWLRLAGHAAEPRVVELDDTPPAPLRE